MILYCITIILLHLFYIIFYHIILYANILLLLYITIIYFYLCLFDIFFIFAGCSVIVGHYGILPCAASLKSLQGLEVRINFVVFLMTL